ncbi:hypothetical protein Bbelb_067690 [Branchiostoma belcheri]|nr:hypothetical protein Bbelb_067690 [Branchiostoma belcheri]
MSPPPEAQAWVPSSVVHGKVASNNREPAVTTEDGTQATEAPRKSRTQYKPPKLVSSLMFPPHGGSESRSSRCVRSRVSFEATRVICGREGRSAAEGVFATERRFRAPNPSLRGKNFLGSKSSLAAAYDRILLASLREKITPTPNKTAKEASSMYHFSCITRPGIELTTYRMQGEHSTHLATAPV